MIQKIVVWVNYLLVLVKKEFLTIFSDPANRIILFVPALMRRYCLVMPQVMMSIMWIMPS